MPGKVNPTQAEAMLMAAIQAIASDVAAHVSAAGIRRHIDCQWLSLASACRR